MWPSVIFKAYYHRLFFQRSIQFYKLLSVAIHSNSFVLFQQFIELYPLLIPSNWGHYLWTINVRFDVDVEVECNDWLDKPLTFLLGLWSSCSQVKKRLSAFLSFNSCSHPISLLLDCFHHHQTFTNCRKIDV